MLSDNLDNYQYRSKHLFKVLVDTGLSTTIDGARMKMHRYKQDGKFTPPVQSNRWTFTKDQILSIVRAFGPGGKGEWHFNG